VEGRTDDTPLCGCLFSRGGDFLSTSSRTSPLRRRHRSRKRLVFLSSRLNGRQGRGAQGERSYCACPGSAGFVACSRAAGKPLLRYSLRKPGVGAGSGPGPTLGGAPVVADKWRRPTTALWRNCGGLSRGGPPDRHGRRDRRPRRTPVGRAGAGGCGGGGGRDTCPTPLGGVRGRVVVAAGSPAALIQYSGIRQCCPTPRCELRADPYLYRSQRRDMFRRERSVTLSSSSLGGIGGRHRLVVRSVEGIAARIDDSLA
jgi:hypothetical protein